MKTIRFGECSPEVRFLQCLLNKHGVGATLKEDSCYGPKTRKVVELFKRGGKSVCQDGEVVDDRTWVKFGSIIHKAYWIELYGQPTNMTCWSAAATMIKGSIMSIGAGSAKAEDGLEPSLNNIEIFIRELGLKLISLQSMPPPSVFYNGLQHGPIWCAFEGNGFKHAVVISGIWSDSDQSGNTTVLRIHDPWPPRHGTVYSSTYKNRMLTVGSTKKLQRAMIKYVAV